MWFSISTVSKALNGSPEIGEAAKELIRETASQMGYFPNAAARLLKTNRSNNLGVLFMMTKCKVVLDTCTFQQF